MDLIPPALLMPWGSGCMMLLQLSLLQPSSVPTDLGKPHGSKPRPVRVTLDSADAKRATFKAQYLFKHQQLCVDDDLTRAQKK